MKTFEEFKREYTEDGAVFRDDTFDKYYEYFRDHAQVGDGATVCFYTDRHACTIIKRTAKTLTLRQCKATLKPDFKPEFDIGGFCAHCTNQNKQDYDYEENPDGTIYTARWSKKKKRFIADKHLRVIAGRREFYDYNF